MQDDTCRLLQDLGLKEAENPFKKGAAVEEIKWNPHRHFSNTVQTNILKKTTDCQAIGHSVPAAIAGFKVMDHKKSLTMATPRRIHYTLVLSSNIGHEELQET